MASFDNVPADTVQHLKNGYNHYGAFGDKSFKGNNMTLKNSDKWMKEAGVFKMKNISTTDSGIEFAKVVGAGHHIMTFKQFQQLCVNLADRAAPKNAQPIFDQLIQKLVQHLSPEIRATQTVNVGGVDRLTDVSKYTGAHKERFNADGTGKGIAGREDVVENDGYVRGFHEKLHPGEEDQAASRAISPKPKEAHEISCSFNSYAAQTMDALRSGYKHFGSFGDQMFKGDNMTLKNSDKWLKEAGVFKMKGISTTETSIEFHKEVGKVNKINFDQWLSFCCRLADRASPDNAQSILNEMVELLKNHEPEVHATKPADMAITDRLTDVSKYTGAHKERFNADGTGKGIAGREDVVENDGYVAAFHDEVKKKHDDEGKTHQK